MTEIIPKDFVLHTSNPKVRDKILTEGIKPMVGDSYRLHWESTKPGVEPPVAIFAVNTKFKKHAYNSTWDDDIWMIDTKKADITWYIDMSGYTGCIWTNKPIGIECITLVYKGSGKSIG